MSPTAKSAQPTPERKAWTILLYMVADGPSGNRALDDIALREIASVVHGVQSRDAHGHRPLDDIYVAVQVDLRSLDGTFRYIANEDEPFKVEQLAETIATSPKTVIDYLSWVEASCPADHHLVVFWGHSSSFLGLFGERPKATGSITQLQIRQIGPLLPSLRRNPSSIGTSRDKDKNKAKLTPGKSPVDIVLFKDCWMSTMEIAFELDGYVDYMMGSQGKVPQIGWPYADIFHSVARVAHAGGSVKDVGRVVLEALASFYDFSVNRPGKDEVPFSLVDLKLMCGKPLRDALDGLVYELGEARKRDAADVKRHDGTMAKLVRALKGPLDAVVRETRGAVGLAFDDVSLGQFVNVMFGPQPQRTAITRDAIERASRSDPALIDLRWMCDNLRRLAGSQYQALRSCAKAVGAVLDKAVTASRKQSAFGGISLFHFPRGAEALVPPELGGSLLVPAIAHDRHLYEKRLKMSRHTHWHRVALESWQGMDFKQRMINVHTSALLAASADLVRSGESVSAFDFVRGSDFVGGNEFGSKGSDFGSKGSDFGSKGSDFGSKGSDFGSKGSDFFISAGGQ